MHPMTVLVGILSAAIALRIVVPETHERTRTDEELYMHTRCPCWAHPDHL